MAKEVVANKEQLIKVAKSHLNIYDDTVGRCSAGSSELYSAYLLKVYAVECAIKALYLKKHSLRSCFGILSGNSVKEKGNKGDL